MDSSGTAEAQVGTDGDVLTIDGGDLSCARLLILLRRHITDLPDGSRVHLSTTDPVAPIDLPAWCRLTGHTYLGVVGEGPPAVYAVAITATPVPTRDDRPWHPR